jgi:uncharacterized protein with HEPN domain
LTEQYVYPDYLGDIVNTAEKAMEFATGMDFTEFLSDDKTKFAVIRCLEIIGEATRQTSSDTLSGYPQIPWRKIVDTRNNLIHNYRNVDMEIVWDILHRDLPHLLATLNPNLSP